MAQLNDLLVTGDARILGSIDSPTMTEKTNYTDFASEFSTSTNYSTGNCVIYNNKFYRCIASHTAGDWNSSHFSEISLNDIQFKNLDTAIKTGKGNQTTVYSVLSDLSKHDLIAGPYSITNSKHILMDTDSNLVNQRFLITYNSSTSYRQFSYSAILTINTKQNSTEAYINYNNFTNMRFIVYTATDAIFGTHHIYLTGFDSTSIENINIYNLDKPLNDSFYVNYVNSAVPSGLTQQPIDITPSIREYQFDGTVDINVTIPMNFKVRYGRKLTICLGGTRANQLDEAYEIFFLNSTTFTARRIGVAGSDWSAGATSFTTQVRSDIIKFVSTTSATWSDSLVITPGSTRPIVVRVSLES